MSLQRKTWKDLQQLGASLDKEQPKGFGESLLCYADDWRSQIERYEQAALEGMPEEWVNELLRRLDGHRDVDDKEVADCIRRFRTYATVLKSQISHKVTCKLFPDPYDEREPVACTCGAIDAAIAALEVKLAAYEQAAREMPENLGSCRGPYVADCIRALANKPKED